MRFSPLALTGIAISITASLLGAVWYTNQPERPAEMVAEPSPEPQEESQKRVVESIQASPALETPTYGVIGTEIARVAATYPDLTIGVGVVDLNNGTELGYHEDEPVIAASTMKVLVAATYLSRVEAGEYNLSDDLYGITAENHLQQMIQQSNNDSWAVFNELLTYEGEEAYAQSIGIPDYQARENTITPRSAAQFLQMLWNRTLLSEAHTQLLLGFMQNTNYETLIPQALPIGVEVYHKYGNLDDSLHDIAIVGRGDQYYAVAIYTVGTTMNEYERTKAIKEIAQVVDAGFTF